MMHQPSAAKEHYGVALLLVPRDKPARVYIHVYQSCRVGMMQNAGLASYSLKLHLGIVPTKWQITLDTALLQGIRASCAGDIDIN